MPVASYSRHILRILAVVTLSCLACPGCTHVQLRKSTVVHSMTLGDIYTQQVLNNLAMFIQNPDALPFFAFPNQGTTQIQDTGTIGGPGNTSNSFVTSPFDLNASRATTENWVLVPVSDPAKLALMRCAYRQAIASCIGTNLNNRPGCPDCRALRTGFFGPKGEGPGNPSSSIDQPCLDSPPWFTWGCEKHTHRPGNCACQARGSYCGVYVCVPPEGRDMLTRLTLAILDYAVNEPEQYTKRTKEVEIYLDKNGDYADANKYARKITATIPIDQPSAELRALDNSSVWIEFQKQGLKKQDADNLIKATFQLDNKPLTDVVARQIYQDPKHWPTRRAADYDNLFPRSKDVFAFFAKNAVFYQITPYDAPSDDLLKGPATFVRKGAASAGLQQFQQQLKAAVP